ncbi:MAG: 30S ribosomal protein S12 methylthiotransferase RimO [Candidatus Omnitrophica bacterium CG11_big_fil_rev_8_21_14_0_20_63_9]|nr:MAG: 30S ribosomal protein S12 methylthiotransferase RimO [Candidatus Omnitrophica bacterium CG11_big_fil_rev_8_21_14_0_20_63_9]
MPNPAASSALPSVPKPGEAKTVSMISLGCPRTLVDSELYLGRLQQKGYQVVDEVEGSDTVIINTCSFIQDSIKESIDTVLQAVEMKKQGKLKAVVVAGCLVQRFKHDLIKELPDVDGFVGVDGFGDIETVVGRALQGEHPESLRPRPNVPHQGRRVARAALTPAHYAYLKVAEGCLKGCSFCVIPKIKGPLSSRPIDALVDEARQLVEERGVVELVVVGQDTSDYGVDLYGTPRIAQLLGALAKINGLRWIRLLYCHPKGISHDLIETIRDEERLCKYLDMAIEHADDGVLQRMNRLVTQAQLRERIQRLRELVPGIALRTSVIVGFPGETEAAFEQLLGFLRDVAFDRLGAFTYSHEEGSASFRYPDQVPDALKHARFDRLMQLQQTIAAELTARTVGRTMDVLIDEPDRDDPRQFLGRTSADCPEVDGLVFVRSDRVLRPGQIVPVRITDSYEYDLVGTALTSPTP